MALALITGSAGLVGAAAAVFFAEKGFDIVGIDNDMRRVFFGKDASTDWQRKNLEKNLKNYTHYSVDVRDKDEIGRIFAKYGKAVDIIIHAAAQPSHDWAAKDPFVDFTVNANGTLAMLEAARTYSPGAVFIYTSTNKVYGDTPNRLPLVEKEKRWEIADGHPYYEYGIDETMSIDNSKHSLFGASKAAADLLTQEYGKYFGMKTGVFRGGCLTGPGHSGTQLHGFLAYLMKCAITGDKYQIFGYKGKQVRDNIHSSDLVNMFWHFFLEPHPGEVYNAGGGRFSNCSMLEAIEICETITGRKMNHEYKEANRIGDHIWYISDVRKFQKHYPGWKYKYGIREILSQIHSELSARIK